jgi:tetratricopeptide (TPR) repeat protein
MCCLLPLLLLMQLSAGDAERLYRESKFSEAASVYRALVNSNPGSAEAWAGLGKSLLQLGRPEAVTSLGRALQLKPGDREIQGALVRAHLQNGNTPAAVALLEPLTEHDANDPQAFCLLGQIMYVGGFYQRALQLLGRSLELDPDNARAQTMYAISLAKVGRSAEAELACRRILDQTHGGLDLDLALTYVELLDDAGRTTAAFPYVDRLIQERPQNPMAHFWRARLLLHSERLADAAVEAERSVTYAPNLPFARNLLVQIYRRQGHLEEAQRQAAWLRDYNDRLTGRDR